MFFRLLYLLTLNWFADLACSQPLADLLLRLCYFDWCVVRGEGRRH